MDCFKLLTQLRRNKERLLLDLIAMARGFSKTSIYLGQYVISVTANITQHCGESKLMSVSIGFIYNMCVALSLYICVGLKFLPSFNQQKMSL